MMAIMSTLNEAQERAVQTTAGPLLIVAGAGSGKTRVITQRILHLVKNGVDPRAILAITFTNKAAKEMQERVHALLASDQTIKQSISPMNRPFLSTFHALGVYIIRENAAKLGLNRHFSIYDRNDSKRAVKDALAEMGIDPKKYDPGLFLNIISRAKGDALDARTFGEKANGFVQETAALVWQKYEQILAKDKALDFDDLLFKTAELLEQPEIRQKYHQRWRYIHIDEYQDTNLIQYQIASRLAEGSRNICVVGDADQNIYSWRGATIENILRFEKDYPDAVVIALEKNYRSTKTILSAANSVIAKNSRRQDKTLYTDNPLGEKISLLSSYSETDEARVIADTARHLIETGVNPKEIAVLYRTNFQSRVLEEAFIRKDIPYQLLGTKFFERKEVKDVLSYVKAALNMTETNDSAFPNGGWADIARIINVPTRGIGKTTIAKLLSGAANDLPGAMAEKVANFWKLLNDIRKEIAERKPSDVIRFIIQETGLEKTLRDGGPDGEERLLNIRELASVASQYDNFPVFGQSEPSATELSGLEMFLENAALYSDQDDLQENREAVKLMTVHAAKGLEFDHVFVSGMEQDLFPFKHLDEEDDADGQEEERRLFYVALTRARLKVYLSYTMVRKIYGTERINTPSEFIDDIDKHLLAEDAAPTKPEGVKAIFIDF